MQKKQAVLHWSGGKDCTYALHLLQQQPEISVRRLFVTLNQENRISMHGVDKSLIEMQAKSIGIPVKFVRLSEHPSNKDYEAAIETAMQSCLRDGIEYSVFGDLFLEDIRKYREKLFKNLRIKTLFPLWKMNTNVLSKKILKAGFKAKIVSANSAKPEKSLAGKEYDQKFLQELPEGIDPCGENGEFHTFVYDGPIFSMPIPVTCGKIIETDFPSPGNPSEKYRITYVKLLSGEMAN
jgi:uncharacterized protein (TIGR00290 family)